jgi:hypothetical protein
VASLVETLTVDCGAPLPLADFWCGVLGYRLGGTEDDTVWIEDPAGNGWTMLFLVVPEGKSVKNRLHLDLRPPASMEDEVVRLEALGASSVRLVAEGGSFWTIMADPEGNEFCVLRGPDDGWEPDEVLT